MKGIICILVLFAIYSLGGGIFILLAKALSLDIPIKFLANIVAQTDYESATVFLVIGIFSGCLARIIEKKFL